MKMINVQNSRKPEKLMIKIYFLTASRIRYEITSGNLGGAFAVKNMTGAIYVAGALDYETRKRVSANELEKRMYTPLFSYAIRQFDL